LSAGANQTLCVTFMPTDTLNYTTASASAHINVIADNTPPAISIWYPNNGVFLLGTVSIGGEITDSGSGVKWTTLSVTLNGMEYGASHGGSFFWCDPSYLADGAYTLAVSVYDNAYNHATAQSTFTLDTTPPTMTQPGNVVKVATSIEGAWLWGSECPPVTAWDAIWGSVDIIMTVNLTTSWTLPYPPQDPILFPIGTTQVTLTATDGAGNSTQKFFDVTVVRGDGLLVPGDMYVEATCPGGAHVSFAPATIIQNGNITYTDASGNTVASGDLFPLGVTTVQVTANYTGGGTETMWFWITVQDTTAPVVTAPADILVPVNRVDGADGVVYGSASASDAVTTSPAISFDTPCAGTTFPVGVTEVTVYAIDSSGNTGTDTFTVTVTQGPLAISSVNPADTSVVFVSEPAISAQVTDASNGATWVLDSMIIDLTENVTEDATLTYTGNIATGVIYTPTLLAALAQGWHTVEVSVSDDANNSTTVHWQFFVAGTGITIYDEAPGERTSVDIGQPTISAFFADSGATINPATLSLAVVSSANVSVPFTVSYSDESSFFAAPDSNLAADTYTVTVSIGDGTNTQSKSWCFYVARLWQIVRRRL